LKKKKTTFRIEIITGKGNHSKNGIAILYPGIMDFLKSEGYKFKTENDSKFFCEVKG